MAETKVELKDEELGDKFLDRFEFDWNISNWQQLQKSSTKVEAVKKEVHMSMASGPVLKWTISMRTISSTDVMVQMRLEDINEFEIERVEIQSYELQGDEQLTYAMALADSTAKVGQVVDTNLLVRINFDNWDIGRYTNSKGELVLRFGMDILFRKSERIKLAKFMETANNRAIENFEALLTMESFQNAKIITGDGKQFKVNKFLLSSRCSVFESMFRSGMQEESSNTVQVPDITGNVMEILIRYWYSGKLADNWSQPDIIEGFTYAAGKYRIEEILDMLDDILGFESIVKSTIQLLDLARKLGLKNAEERMVKSIGRRAVEAKSSEELLNLFSCSCSVTQPVVKQIPEVP